MAVVPSDLVTQWSTEFETLFLAQFNQSVAVEWARLEPLIMEIPLGDHMGNTVQLDWLGAAPQMREWVDEKQALGIGEHNWSVRVKRYEASIDVDLDAFRDARFNPYQPRLLEMAQNASRIRYNLLSDLVVGGASAKCYDGQNFFDTSHSEGDSGVQSNKLTGTGTTAAALKADYYSAYTALCGFKDDKGVPMAPSEFRPLIWAPNSAALIQQFEDLRGAPLISNSTNILANRFDLVIDPRDFISAPFRRCPACGAKDEYGLLMVGYRQYTRRCRACWFTKSTQLPRLNKKVIYIDQCGLSEMMKAMDPSSPSHLAAAKHPLWKPLFQKLHRLALIQLIGCPTSRFHAEESRLYRYGGEVVSLMRVLDGGVKLHEPETVLHAQLIRHVEHWLNGTRADYQGLIVKGDAISDGLDEWTDRISVYCDSSRTPEQVQELRDSRGRTDTAMTDVFDGWRAERLSLDEFYEREVQVWGPLVWRLYRQQRARQTEWMTGMRPMTEEDLFPGDATIKVGMIREGLKRCNVPEGESLLKAAEYLHSPRVCELPFLHLSALMYATEARKASGDGKRNPPSPGFITDVQMISTYLPYCDAMFVDNACAGYLHEIRRRHPFQTRIFSARTGASFLDYLETIEAGATKAHMRRVRSIYGRGWGDPSEAVNWSRCSSE